ncbi:MAG: 2-oxoacid:acceptor oxidoreductase subunit alpha [Deltaproteobacteria bacterium]|nr:2-oxoacid:acceptor oxidoreductase subunit alpha [Deltaproteobacteria bacterium]
MSAVDLTIEICGMSGDGTIAAGVLLNNALSDAGYSIMALDSYPAEIRGFGRCVTRTRIGNKEMTALSYKTNVLISLDDEQSRSRVPFLTNDAIILFDNRPPNFITEEKALLPLLEPEMNIFGIPFGDLATRASGTRRGINLAALGAFAALFGIPAEHFYNAIKRKFKAKGEKVLESNLKCFDAGMEYCLDSKEFRGKKILHIGAIGVSSEKRLISGNEAISMGALDAGLSLYFGYPITPATPVMEYLAKYLPERGGRLMQMEDEISSIGAVLGSFFAGRRAMTATSGPGFALMTELIAHATVAEIPAVIVNAQRGGPGTGLPTKTEQSDLQAAVFGGPGDSARIVLAPSNVKECYHFTLKSFQIAERYQTPVIILTDFFLHNRVENIDSPNPSDEDVKNGNIMPDESKKGNYRRFENTESGISPRAMPGMEGYIFTATGLEHTEKGKPDYTAENHMVMSEKRHRKIYNALKDLPEPLEHNPEDTYVIGIITWGSTSGAAIEAVNLAREKGIKAGMLKIASIFPYHEDRIKEFMNKCDEILIPELNFEGQLANLIGHLYRKEVKRFNRVTGVPLTAIDILKTIEKLV